MSEDSDLPVWRPLVEYRRLDIAEVLIHGAVSWVSGTTVIHESGGENLIFGRSLTKPFQMKGIAKSLAGVLTPEGKALSVASHGSEDFQIQALKTILDPENLNLIATPVSQPLSPYGVKGAASALYHPCSGKHAAILKACELNGWSTENYTSPEHPYHKTYFAELRKILGNDWQPRAMAKDGCGLATYSMTVTELAKLFSSLARTPDEDWIWSAMIDHPEIVGGTGRLDTAIMKETGGNVLAKEGADGLLGLSIRHANYPDGLGVVVKIAHGWDPKATQFIASALLRTLGFGFGNPAALDRQKAFVSDAIVPLNLAPQLLKIISTDTAPTIDDKY